MDIPKNWRTYIFRLVQTVGFFVFVFKFHDFLKLYHLVNIFNGIFVGRPVMLAQSRVKERVREIQDPVTRLVCFLVYVVAVAIPLDFYFTYCNLYVLFVSFKLLAVVITDIINFF